MALSYSQNYTALPKPEKIFETVEHFQHALINQSGSNSMAGVSQIGSFGIEGTPVDIAALPLLVVQNLATFPRLFR